MSEHSSGNGADDGGQTAPVAVYDMADVHNLSVELLNLLDRFEPGLALAAVLLTATRYFLQEEPTAKAEVAHVQDLFQHMNLYFMPTKGDAN